MSLKQRRPIKKRFQGDYVRGGASTLYMTREDVVETLAMIKVKYPGQIQELLSAANARLKEWRVEESQA